MDKLSARLEQAADTLSTMDRRMPDRTLTAGVFGADDIGAPGRLGRELFAHWTAVLTARSTEAASAAARLAEVAASVRVTATAYAETDDAARRRFQREM